VIEGVRGELIKALLENEKKGGRFEENARELAKLRETLGRKAAPQTLN